MMKIALFQPRIFLEDTNALLSAYEQVLSTIDRGSVDLVVFPEFFSTGFYMDFENFEMIDNGRTLSWMKKVSERLDCAVAGSVPVKPENGKAVNRFYFQAPETSSFYDKRHVFMGPESDAFTPGCARSIVSYRGMNILLQLCYDMRFPVWSRVKNADYDLVLNLAQWPESRIAVPQKLSVARAIENQSYYVFCNWEAVIHGEQEGGASHLVSPDGEVQHPSEVRLTETAKLLFYEVDEKIPAHVRKRFKVWRDADSFELD